MKAKITKIVLMRIEGPIRDCEKIATVKSFAQANSVLCRWSMSAPKNGGYDKCDFHIEFEDGDTYDGRYDLVHWKNEWPNLGNHVRSVVGCVTGSKRPYWMNDEQWAQNLKNHADLTPSWKAFEDSHDLDDEKIGN